MKINDLCRIFCTYVLNLILSVFRTLQQNIKLSLYRGTSHFMAEGVLLCYARPFTVDIVDADALTTLRVLEPAPARHSKSKLFLCSRLTAAFTFQSSAFSFQFSVLTFPFSAFSLTLPASVISPRASSEAQRSMFSCVQWLLGRRGDRRCTNRPSGKRFSVLSTDERNKCRGSLHTMPCKKEEDDSQSTRSKEPPPPPQHTAQPATPARTCHGRSPPNNISPCRGSP